MSKAKKFFEKLVRKLLAYLEDKAGDSVHTDTQPTPTEPEEIPTPTQPSSNETLDNFKCDWCYGGYNGSKATEDPSVQISNLRVLPDKNVMTYEWFLQIAKLWGLDYGEAGALACLFYKKGNKWLGGKFDWISVSRTSRDLKNVQSGYGGWNWAEFSHSREFAFCIASKDGKKRSNFIFYSK